MNSQLARHLPIGSALIALTACGGGGTSVAPIPAPPVAPAPQPAPPPPPPPPPDTTHAPVTVSQSTEFQTVATDVRIRFDSSANRYEIMLPGKDWASLSPKNEVSYDIGDPTGGSAAYFSGGDKYDYTGLASVFVGDTSQTFAYGIATPASGMPVTGSASYTADLAGGGGGFYVGGTAHFDFDFAKGTLGGFMQLVGNDPAGWGPYELGGRREFVNTVYASGSPTFSGAVSTTGLPDGSFSGMFTGPQGQELMGKWQVPFEDVYNPGTIVTGTGVLVGKKTP